MKLYKRTRGTCRSYYCTTQENILYCVSIKHLRVITVRAKYNGEHLKVQYPYNSEHLKVH